MKCPQCHSYISIAYLMTGSNRQHAPGDVQTSGMICPTCRNRISYGFSTYWLWASTFFALLGLSKIGHLQMICHYALQVYVFTCVCGIVLSSVRLSVTPGPLEKAGPGALHRIHFILYLFLYGVAFFIAADIYSGLVPAKSSLIEKKGRIKEIGIRNGRFSFITLDSPHNIEFLVNDKFDSPAAHLQPGASVSLFVDKDPSITGDAYTVWEVRDSEATVLLPYEDLRTIRIFEANKARGPFLVFFIALLLGYVGTRYLVKQNNSAKIINAKIKKPQSELLITHSSPIDSMEFNTELELGEEFHHNPFSALPTFKNINYSTQNILALIAIISVIAAVLSRFMFLSFTVLIISSFIFIVSVAIIILLSVTKLMVNIFRINKILFAVLMLLIVAPISVYVFGSPVRFYENLTAPPAITKTANTAFTAHLEGPLTAGKNVLYCASFQKAWDVMYNQIVREEVRLAGDPLTARQLNRQLLGNGDISLDSYVAGAGPFSQELIDRVNKELREKFGSQADINFTMPQASGGDRSIIAYAFLYKNLEFPTEFEKLTGPLLFHANDRSTPVKAFGIDLFSHTKPLHEKLADQVAIFDYRDDNDFILSLISKSKDDEIILAKVKPGKTLLDTYQAVAKRIARGKRTGIWEKESIKIPKIDFDLSHNFPELEGKQLLNRGWEEWHIAAAVQDIRFKLDEKGAVLKSRAFMMAKKAEAPAPGNAKPRMFIFDKPFLICLKQKTGTYPYFAIWLNNPELMRKN